MMIFITIINILLIYLLGIMLSTINSKIVMLKSF